MSRSNRRKFSEFSTLAAARIQTNDSEESLFEFEAPRYADLTQVSQEPPYSRNILNFSIKTKSHDDYWFTYSHFLHEEEEDTHYDPNKLSKRASNIHTKALQLTKHDDHNTHTKNEIIVETTRQKSENREVFLHHETRAIKVQQTTTKNVLLKSQKKRFTISHTKIEILKLDTTKEALLGRLEAVQNEKAHVVQPKVLNAPAIKAKENNENLENENPNQIQNHNHTVKKRKAPTSSSDRDLMETNPINYKKVVTNTKKNAMQITPTKVDKENDNTPIEPILKRMKGNDSPHPNAKKGEPIKINLRNTRLSHAHMPLNAPTTLHKERNASQTSGVTQRDTSRNTRRSMHGMQFSNNLAGIAHHKPEPKKPIEAETKIERNVLAELNMDESKNRWIYKL